MAIHIINYFNLKGINLKIYNYSDKPIIINGVSRDEHTLHLNSSIPLVNVKHDGISFLPQTSQDRNVIFTITNTSEGYSYIEDHMSIPDVWMWISIFFTFFAFHFLIRIAQKLKMQ